MFYTKGLRPKLIWSYGVDLCAVDGGTNTANYLTSSISFDG